MTVDKDLTAQLPEPSLITVEHLLQKIGSQAMEIELLQTENQRLRGWLEQSQNGAETEEAVAE